MRPALFALLMVSFIIVSCTKEKIVEKLVYPNTSNYTTQQKLAGLHYAKAWRLVKVGLPLAPATGCSLSARQEFATDGSYGYFSVNANCPVTGYSDNTWSWNPTDSIITFQLNGGAQTVRHRVLYLTDSIYRYNQLSNGGTIVTQAENVAVK
jgi:hypothetical protein